MINLLKIFLRLPTELLDLETFASTEITPSLPAGNHESGGYFLLGANECRKSGELSLFELNRPFTICLTDTFRFILDSSNQLSVG